MTRLPITTALILAALSFGAAPAQAGDAAAGEKVFNKCKACHQVGETAKNRVGPVLNGIVGRAAGSVEGFKYSDALSGSGLTWDEATLAAFLTDPKATVPGNKMAFPGLRKDAEIADVIAFLASHNADGTRQ